MLALIDESARAHGQPFHYVVAAAFLHEDVEVVRQTLRSAIGGDGRRNPFHWADEGPVMRSRIVAIAGEYLVQAVVGARRVEIARYQEHARAEVLRTVILPAVVAARADTMIIETRDDHVANRVPRRRLGQLDDRDRQTIRDFLRPWRGQPAFAWRGKDEPLLWLPDAIAGLVREHLDDHDSRWHSQLVDLGVRTAVEVIA